MEVSPKIEEVALLIYSNFGLSFSKLIEEKLIGSVTKNNAADLAAASCFYTYELIGDGLHIALQQAIKAQQPNNFDVLSESDFDNGADYMLKEPERICFWFLKSFGMDHISVLPDLMESYQHSYDRVLESYNKDVSLEIFSNPHATLPNYMSDAFSKIVDSPSVEFEVTMFYKAHKAGTYKTLLSHIEQ